VFCPTMTVRWMFPALPHSPSRFSAFGRPVAEWCWYRAALSARRHSSLALDIYTGLAHRLCRVRTVGGIKLSWENLREQFGQEYNTSKDFKKEFRHALRQVLVVYPDAKLGDAAGGLILYPSRPPLSKTSLAFRIPKI